MTPFEVVLVLVALLLLFAFVAAVAGVVYVASKVVRYINDRTPPQRSDSPTGRPRD